MDTKGYLLGIMRYNCEFLSPPVYHGVMVLEGRKTATLLLLIKSMVLSLCMRSSIDALLKISVRFLDPWVLFFPRRHLSSLMKHVCKLLKSFALCWHQPLSCNGLIGLTFEITCDAPDHEVGTELGQWVNKVPHVIYDVSKTLADAQLNYTTAKKELLVVVL